MAAKKVTKSTKRKSPPKIKHSIEAVSLKGMRKASGHVDGRSVKSAAHRKAISEGLKRHHAGKKKAPATKFAKGDAMGRAQAKRDAAKFAKSDTSAAGKRSKAKIKELSKKTAPKKYRDMSTKDLEKLFFSSKNKPERRMANMALKARGK